MYSDHVSAARPLEEPRLNFDILHLVCDYLTDIPDVLSFSRTCSSLTEDALRRRLRMAPVDLSSAEVINKFHAFIFSNLPSRAPWIYGLALPSQYKFPLDMDSADLQTTDEHVVAILEAAVYIQYLDISTSVSPAMFDAVVKATTVRKLKIFAATYEQPLLRHLSNFRSPLRFLQITGSEQVEGTISASFLHDHLSHFAPTLEFLDLDNFELDIHPSSVTTQFAAVRSLKIQVIDIPTFHPLDVLIQLFPNLDNTLKISLLDILLTIEESLAFRERSKEVQKQHAWLSLDRLICDALTAYLLALHCPIRRIDIKTPSPHRNWYLADTLRHNPPLHLHVSVSLYGGFESVLDDMFPPEAADRLTHLVLFADAVWGDKQGELRKANNVHWDRFANRLIRAIKDLRLTHIHVVFHTSVYQSAREILPDGALMKTACAIDLLPAATRFVDAIPSLKYIFLTACGHTYAVPSYNWEAVFLQQTLDRWLSSKAWRVIRDAEDLHDPDAASGSCVELSKQAAERIMDEEELGLSRHEEGKVRGCASSEKE